MPNQSRISRGARSSPAVQTTAYFKELRTRPDRALIRDEWILRAIEALIRETVQTDGRIRS